jgi:nucleoporin NUP42
MNALTANCRFEHPGANANAFGGQSNNRYNALSSGGGGGSGGSVRDSRDNRDGSNPYKITKDLIKIDLLDERPAWILSSYGPGRDAPEQLFGGHPREQSFEEIRLLVTGSPNTQQAVSRIDWVGTLPCCMFK